MAGFSYRRTPSADVRPRPSGRFAAIDARSEVFEAVEALPPVPRTMPTARTRDVAESAPASTLRVTSGVTVIVPAYNEAASIGDTVRSLFAQTVVPDEVIVEIVDEVVVPLLHAASPETNGT